MKKLIIILFLVLAVNCFAIEVERQKNVATVITFPLFDSTTTTALQSGAGSLDSELDQFSDSGDNPDGFADCTNEATEIGSTGQYYLVLTQGEMNENYISVQIKASDAITQTILIRTVAATSVAGVPEVDITHIGGQAISGNNATLKLKQLDITNSAGTAFIAKSTGSNGHGVDFAGNGTGEGLKATGGTTGHGIDGQGGPSGGQGLNAKANGGNGAGALFQGEGTGEGLDARGGATGEGISGLGGGTSGAGIYGKAQGNNDAGMELIKHGTGDDLDADTIADDTAAILLDTAAYDTDAEYAAALWNAATASYGGAGTYGQVLEDGIGGATAQQVWEYDISAITTSGYAGLYLRYAGGIYTINMEVLGHLASLWVNDCDLLYLAQL